MRITLLRTRDWKEPREEKCSVCGEPFYLGEVSPVLVSDGGVELGETCLACLSAGPEYVQEKLEDRARLSRTIADEDERIASEGITDFPSVDEILLAEAFYKGD